MENSVFQSKSLSKAYFRLALPVVFSMVISIVYNITDTYFIALTQNTSLVAGVSLCAPVFTLLMAFGNIFGQGGSSLLSRLLGKQETEGTRRVSAFCFYVSIALGIVLGALMLLLRTQILRLLGADENTFAYASSYYTWMAIDAPFAVLSFIHTNLLRAEGMSRESMVGTIGGSVVNIILDPVMIFGLRMGAAGAAIATILGYLFTDLYCLWVVLRKSRALSVDIRKWRISSSGIGQIFGIGTSAALTNLMQSLALVLMNQNLLIYGSDKIAVMGIVQKISMVVMLVLVGFSFGGAPLIGYCYGSGDSERLNQLQRFVLRFLCAVALAMSAALILAAPAAVRLFLNEEVLVETGVWMLRTQVSSMVFLAVVLFISIVLQATGKTGPSLLLSVSRQGIVYVIVLYIAVRVGEYNGILLSQPIADVLTAGLALILYRRCRN